MSRTHSTQAAYRYRSSREMRCTTRGHRYVWHLEDGSTRQRARRYGQLCRRYFAGLQRLHRRMRRRQLERAFSLGLLTAALARRPRRAGKVCRSLARQLGRESSAPLATHATPDDACSAKLAP